MILKIIIIIAILIIGIWLTKARKNTRVRAWQKLLFLLFVFGVIFLTLFPEIALRISNLIGLSRVTDLIVYGNLIFVLFVMVNVYLKFQELQAQIAKLARTEAVQDGLNRYASWQTEK